MASVKFEVTLDAFKYIDALERARAALKAIDEPSEQTKKLRAQIAGMVFISTADPLHHLLTLSERQDRLEAFALRQAAARSAQSKVVPPAELSESERAEIRKIVNKQNLGPIQVLPIGVETRPHTHEIFRAACNIPKGTQLGIDQWLRTIAPRSLAHKLDAGRASEDIVEGDLIMVTFDERRQIIKTVNADYHVGVDMAHGQDFTAIDEVYLQRVAELFRVPPEMLGAPCHKPEVPKIGTPLPSVSAADMKITYKPADCVIPQGLIDRTIDLTLEYSRESEPAPLPAAEPESKPVKFREFL